MYVKQVGKFNLWAVFSSDGDILAAGFETKAEALAWRPY